MPCCICSNKLVIRKVSSSPPLPCPPPPPIIFVLPFTSFQTLSLGLVPPPERNQPSITMCSGELHNGYCVCVSVCAHALAHIHGVYVDACMHAFVTYLPAYIAHPVFTHICSSTLRLISCLLYTSRCV